MPHYAIRHKTRLRYSAQVSESVSEVRMQPRSEGRQRCVSFGLSVAPTTRVLSFTDHLGNIVHHFSLPAPHRQVVITAEALVEVDGPPELPEALTPEAWAELDGLVAHEDHWDFLMPSRFTEATPLLEGLARELDVGRRDDPLTLLRSVMAGIYRSFDYAPQTTRVDSPIDEALAARKGVCQDFSHIMIALVRQAGIPCRYVSGYLFHRREDHDRSEQDATHAWVEALLPGLGWVGFDPTNNLMAGERHIRVAVGRDYSDVPPTRGVYRGNAANSIEVGVRVVPTETPPPDEEMVLTAYGGTAPIPDDTLQQQQEQQQQ